MSASPRPDPALAQSETPGGGAFAGPPERQPSHPARVAPEPMIDHSASMNERPACRGSDRRCFHSPHFML
jgi:hypothetical protein